jgi:hypothetical protein
MGQLVSIIDNLSRYESSDCNFEFEKWHKDVEINLAYIFKDDDRKHVQDFTRINFRQKTQLWTDELYGKTPSNDYYNGLQKSKALLQSFIDEVNSYWESKKTESVVPNDALENLKLLLVKFHKAAVRIISRHDKRETLKITDEYDVQDLMASLLNVFFDDIREEECTPSYAGGASRIDFLLNDSNIALEVKKTRDTLTDKQIGEQVLVDIQCYKSHPKVKKLICFIYDPGWKIRNPKALEKDLASAGSELETEIFIAPKRCFSCNRSRYNY